jgi:hypothetical protein
MRIAPILPSAETLGANDRIAIRTARVISTTPRAAAKARTPTTPMPTT